MITFNKPNGLQIEPLPAFSDNYLWLIHNGIDAAVVDPGDAAVVQAAVKRKNLTLRHILVTHHHADHVGGLAALKAQNDLQIYGPAAESGRIALLDHLLTDGATLHLPTLGLSFSIMEVPGHTIGHIAYFCGDTRPSGILFCGDTLFSAGCGRLFEGTPSQMLHSLQRLAALGGRTEVYCAHEYTLSNLLFATEADPGNIDVKDAIQEVRVLREQHLPTLPSTLEREKKINPFLRCSSPSVIETISRHAGLSGRLSEVEIFAAMRTWKDQFKT